MCKFGLINNAIIVNVHLCASSTVAFDISICQKVTSSNTTTSTTPPSSSSDGQWKPLKAERPKCSVDKVKDPKSMTKYKKNLCFAVNIQCNTAVYVNDTAAERCHTRVGPIKRCAAGC